MLKRLLGSASRFFRRLPDGPANRLLYYRRMGHQLNLNNPTTFTEKLQWLKLYDRRPIQHQLVNKYTVCRQIVTEKIGSPFLCKLYGVLGSDRKIFQSIPCQWISVSRSFRGRTVTSFAGTRRFLLGGGQGEAAALADHGLLQTVAGVGL